MKISKSMIATVVIAAAMFAGQAAAFAPLGVSSADLNVTVTNGIATLFGHVDSNLDRVLAENAAAALDGVTEVRNLITFSK